MLNINLFENIDVHFKCFSKKKKKKFSPIDKHLYDISREYNISILPITEEFYITNLYPPSDNVDKWNIFIIGNDKTYILANINDSHVFIPNVGELINHKGINILPDELLKIFDSLWDQTLNGYQLQFYMVWNGKLYFMNSYPFYNEKSCCIGAIMFMREFYNVPNTQLKVHKAIIPTMVFKKKSIDDQSTRKIKSIDSS